MSDHPAGDRPQPGDQRQAPVMVPGGIADLHPIDLDLAAGVFGEEAEHQLAREGPGLTAEITERADADGYLLADLPVHCGFHRLARLDKTGEGAVHPLLEARRPRQQQLFAAGDEDDDAG